MQMMLKYFFDRQSLMHRVFIGILLLIAASLFTACSGKRLSKDEVTWWIDQYPGRGHEVLARDYKWCSDASENSATLRENCLINRGWMIKANADQR
jgi:hypothetical protein